LLDNDDILTSPVGAAPIAPPADDEGIVTAEFEGTPAEQQKPPAAATLTGATLFERMQNMARGASQVKPTKLRRTGTSSEPIDIPRFLNRQNNQ
jgi:cell division protein FtsZ